MSVKVDGVVEIPKHQWYQVLDHLTRIDELLEVLIKQINYTNTLLARLLGLPPVAPVVPEFPTRLVALPYRVRLVYTKTFVVGDEKFIDIPLMHDILILTADSDILIAEKPEAPGFLLVAGTYMIISRSEVFTTLYVRSSIGSANVYMAFFEVGE